jgi:predicted nuclease with RNAse H fold
MAPNKGVVRKARIELLIYGAALCAGSVPIQWMIVRDGLSLVRLLALMWVPVFAAALARRIL